MEEKFSLRRIGRKGSAVPESMTFILNIGGVLRSLCLLMTLICALLALLIILPAPSYYCWLLAVVVSEWSVWLIVAGIVGAAWAGWYILMDRLSAFACASFILSLGAIACAAIPCAQAYRLASEEGLSLSLNRYLFGIDRQGPPLDIDEERDVQFASPSGNPLRLDIYRRRQNEPEKQSGAGSTVLSPAIIVIHGGSWSGGTKSDFARYDRWLAGGGRLVFDVEYRLANRASQFPNQIVDIQCAIAWVRSHSAKYSLDPARIVLMGRSAGAQLALLAAYAPNDPALAGNCRTQDRRVRAVISFYGPTDLAWDYEHPGRPDVIDTKEVLENYLGGSPATAREAYALASPVAHVTSRSPPTLLLHGGHDQIVLAANEDRLISKLQAEGVPYDYIYLPWGNHGFDYNFNGWSSQIAQAKISDFLSKYCDSPAVK